MSRLLYLKSCECGCHRWKKVDLIKDMVINMNIFEKSFKFDKVVCPLPRLIREA